MGTVEAVTELVRRSGMTKKALCEAAGISRSSLDSYLKGERQPSVAQLQRLGEAAGLRLDVSWRTPKVELDIRPVPSWAQPHPDMEAPPLTIEQRARALEIVVAAAVVQQRRPRGELEFPPFRTLVAR